MKYTLKKALIPLAILIITLTCTVILSSFEVIAEYGFSRGISRGINYIMSKIGGIFPFSLYEWLFVALIIVAVGIILTTLILAIKGRIKLMGKILYVCVIVCLCAALFFVLSARGGYNRCSIDKGLGLVRAETNTQRLVEAADYFIKELNIESQRVERDEDGNSVSPYSIDEISSISSEQLNAINRDGYLNNFDTRVKKVVMSEAMSYLSISGIYMPFTGESNVSTNVLDYELPCTVAHEMAHGRGIMREDEANVIAYYVCMRAGGYMRYSALMNIVMDLTYEIYYHDIEEYKRLWEGVVETIKIEISNMYAHNEKYDGIFDDIGRWVNNIFLKSNGQSEGIATYSKTSGYILGLYNEVRG